MGTQIDKTQVPSSLILPAIIPQDGFIFPSGAVVKAYFEDSIYSPTPIFYDGTSLRKYLSVYSDGTYMYVIFSDDGITWNSQATITGTAPNGYHSSAIVIGTTFHLFYWDSSLIYTPAAIRHATFNISTSCSAATSDTPLSGNYVTGIDGNLRYGTYGAWKVFYNASPTNNILNPYSYQWCIIHDGTDGNVEGILFAVSTDGYSFSAWNSLNEVIPRGTGSAWDLQIGALDIWIEGSIWYCLYSGGLGTSNGSDTNFGDGIGWATSLDGINWIKSSLEPAMFKTMANKTALRCYCPSVLKEDDGWRLYYTGKSSTGTYRVCKAILNQLY